METKICKSCGRELPMSNFASNRFGPMSVCRDCVREKNRDTRFNHKKAVAKISKPLFDPEFDNQVPGDVWRMMCRAKKWLESRGFIIKLDGEYREVKVKKLKLE